MSPTRNFNRCSLYKDNKLVKDFQSIEEASHYARDNYSASYSSMTKYLRWKDLYVLTEKTDRKVLYDNQIHKTQNRAPIHLYVNEKYIGEFKTCTAVAKLLKQNYQITISDRWLSKKAIYDEINNIRVIKVSQ